jgi:hypothetical protein
MLKYLFAVRYKDGSEYHQNAQDRSKYHPLKSCFYDAVFRHSLHHEVIVENGEQVMRDDIEAMWLHENGNIVAMVDFRTCTLHCPQGSIPPPVWPLHNIRPVYFRRNVVESQGDSMKARVSSYFLGWQAINNAGKNEQRTLEIKT